MDNFDVIINEASIVGERFKYPNSDEVYTVSEVGVSAVFFECGHWCTKGVFMDFLINIKTGKQAYEYLDNICLF